MMHSQVDTFTPPAKKTREFSETWKVRLWQSGILFILLGGWEALTHVPWFIANTVFDPFFVSRPSLVALQLWNWTFGNQPGYIFPHLAATLLATFLGFVTGVASGVGVGLLLGQYRLLHKVLNPFIVGVNSMPRIAFIPLITMIFGLGLVSKVVASWMVVFFIVFFNTYKGSVSIDREIIDFCRTLGANNRQVTTSVRIPTAAAWAFTSFPNAVSFALIGVVVAEFVGSTVGMGALITLSLASLNATEMFSALFLLSAVGMVLVYGIAQIEKRVMHWAPEHRTAE